MPDQPELSSDRSLPQKRIRADKAELHKGGALFIKSVPRENFGYVKSIRWIKAGKALVTNAL